MTKARKRDAREPPRTLVECEVGDIVQTPAGHLSVTGIIGGRLLVRTWCPDTQSERSKPFAVSSDVRVQRLVADQRRFLSGSQTDTPVDDPVSGRGTEDPLFLNPQETRRA